MTDSMRRAIDETERRRAIQMAYNQEHGITPQSIISKIDMELAGIVNADYVDIADDAADVESFTTQEQLDTYIAALESDMREAAKKFEFEKAAQLREKVRELKTKEFIFTGSEAAGEPAPNCSLGLRRRRRSAWQDHAGMPCDLYPLSIHLPRDRCNT